MTNPLTCLHNIITGRVHIDTFEYDFVCVSCNTPRTVEWLLARRWKYDVDERVWVHVPQK